MFTMMTIFVHDFYLEYEKNNLKKLSGQTKFGKSYFTSDEEGHYDIDGVSFSSQGVIVASDAAILNEVNGAYLSFIQMLSRYS